MWEAFLLGIPSTELQAPLTFIRRQRTHDLHPELTKELQALYSAAGTHSQTSWLCSQLGLIRVLNPLTPLEAKLTGCLLLIDKLHLQKLLIKPLCAFAAQSSDGAVLAHQKQGKELPQLELRDPAQCCRNGKDKSDSKTMHGINGFHLLTSSHKAPTPNTKHRAAPKGSPKSRTERQPSPACTKPIPLTIPLPTLSVHILKHKNSHGNSIVISLLVQ